MSNIIQDIMHFQEIRQNKRNPFHLTNINKKNQSHQAIVISVISFLNNKPYILIHKFIKKIIKSMENVSHRYLNNNSQYILHIQYKSSQRVIWNEI